MQYTECRHENERPHSSLFVICFLSVFICAAALGTLRLYGLYLEHRISETAGRIEACRESNLDMSKKYSELLSPARIYSYAREELGMVNADDIRTVKVDNSDIMVARAVVYPVKEETGFLDYINPFVRKAHAKN
ncbi:MAG: hypothetical protein AB7C92_00410 [Synergistaceae bacterium]